MIQDNLYDLIQSLSRNEKRYFTVNGGKEESNHIRLFRLMSGMKVFDEEVLKKAFTKNLSWEKGNLYKLILKVMRNYQNEKSAYLTIKQLIIDANFLIARGLFEQSLIILEKAKKKATSHHLLTDLLEISRLTYISWTQINPDDLNTRTEELIEVRKQLMKELIEEADYTNLYLELQGKYFQRYTLSSEEDKASLIAKYSAKLTDNVEIQSVRSQLALLMAKKFFAQLTGKPDEVYQICEQIVMWWDKHEAIKQEENYSYLKSLINFIVACSYVQKFEKMPPVIQAIEKVNPKNSMEKNLIFFSLLRYKNLYLMNTGAFLKAKKEFLNIEEQLRKSTIDNQSRTNIIINFSILLFILEDFQDCIVRINQILENKNVEKRHQVQQLARLLKCICYFELNHINEFESTVRSANNFFISMKLEKDCFEFQTLKHLKIIAGLYVKERKPAYEKMKEFLEKERKSPTDGFSIGLEELILWVESKLLGISILDLFVQKHLRK